MEQDRTDVGPMEFRSEPFLGREKPSEFHSELFLGREKPSEYCSKPFLPQNSVLNHFSEEKNPRNSVPNHFWMRKTSEFPSEPFLEEKKPRNSVRNHFWKRKNFGILFRIIFGRKKLCKKTTFVSCFVKLHYFAELRSVSFQVSEWTLPKYLESPRMSTLFCRIMKTVPSLFHEIFSELNFNGNLRWYPHWISRHCDVYLHFQSSILWGTPPQPPPRRRWYQPLPPRISWS
jgi:hypothetical protein